jgi:predicted GTPase/gas vesicle protein
MSGSISRSVSLMSPEDGGGLAAGLPPSTPSKGGAASDPSPLQLFVQAKKKINEIFREIGDYVGDSESFLCSVPDDIIPQETLKKAKDYKGKVAGITEVLERDHMKVAFFGRTSNGKSTTINSLLSEKILPTGIGHTTSCFLQVEGSKAKEAYLTVEDSEEHLKLSCLGELGNALCDKKLESNAQVRIHWPVERCRLLGEEVVIIDSPGIDVDVDLDDWIDKHCLDSDVFVLVSNAESTIMLTEKKFFHKVSEKLSNPNLFIVHNRWDCSAGEDCQAQVRQQHTERAIEFLSKELKICTKEEAESRIFFISAKEALQTRLQEVKGLKPNISTEDYFTRYLEFQEFEKQLEYSLSSTAVKTKFAAHTARGKDIISSSGSMMLDIQDLSHYNKKSEENAKKELMDRLDFTERQLEMMTYEMKDKISSIVEDVEYKVAKALSDEIRRLSVLVDEFNEPFHPDPLVVNVYKSKLNQHIESGVGSNLKSRLSTDLSQNMEIQQKELMDRLDFTERQLEMMTYEMKDKISSIVEDVEYKVAKALSDEIRRLSVLVDEFNEPFHPDPLVVNVYKSKLNQHIESGVGSNLKSRLSTDLSQNMEIQQKEMMDRMTALLPPEKQTVSRNILPRRETFEVLYHLNCENLCSDFQEDLSFRFSLGFGALMKRMMSSTQVKRRGGAGGSPYSSSSIPRNNLPPLTPDTPSFDSFIPPQDDWSVLSKVAIASISSQGTMGGLIMGGLLFKTVGWRILAFTGMVYGVVYAYERLTWTNQARMRLFKRQYVDHAARKLRLIVDMTSANCSHQVQQELSSTFARLCHLVDESTADMKEDLKQIDRTIKDLEEVCSRSKVLRNEASFLANKLEMFQSSYLGSI